MLGFIKDFPGHGRFFPRSCGVRISDVGALALALGRRRGIHWKRRTETWGEDNNAWRTGEVGLAKKAKVRGGGEPKSVFDRPRSLFPHDPTGSGFSDVGALALASHADF